MRVRTGIFLGHFSTTARINFGRIYMSARTRKLCMEKMEERQLMAADVGASVGKASLVNAAQASSGADGAGRSALNAQTSFAPITSTAFGGTTAGGTTASLNAAVNNNGIILVPLAPTTATVQLKNGDIHIEGTNGHDVVNVSIVKQPIQRQSEQHDLPVHQNVGIWRRCVLQRLRRQRLVPQ